MQVLDVEQFNLQKNQVAISAKSDTVAMKRFEVTKQRFLIGKIAVLELNDADARKDQNRREKQEFRIQESGGRIKAEKNITKTPSTRTAGKNAKERKHEISKVLDAD